MEYEIVYNSEDYLVINKPASVVVNRAESVNGETVQDWIEKKMSSRGGIPDVAIQNPVIPTGMEGSLSEDKGISPLRFASVEMTPIARDDNIDTGFPLKGDRGATTEYARNDGGDVRDEELFRKRSGICHRLDKETSGCLLIAKNPAALIHALKEFKERRVEKEYLALVHGLVNPKEGTIKLPLARTRFDREKFEVRFSGKIAETSWKVEQSFQRSAFSGQLPVTLVRLFPKTGRTHQIRVHLSHMGFPIWSDERYLRKDFLLEDRKHLSHHFLHAEVLRLKSISGEMIEARAKLPEDETGLISWINGE